MAYTEETIARYQFTENTVFGNQSPFFYANSIIDIFPPALLGAKACMIPATALSFPKTLVNYLAAEGHHGVDDDAIELRAGGKQRRADGKLPAGA